MFSNRLQNNSIFNTSVPIDTFQTNTIDNQDTYKKIPDDIMLAIVKNYDYKKKSNPQQAANLLFQQCFLAQQDEINYTIQLDSNKKITATSYIYDWFFTIDGICEQVKQDKNNNKITEMQAHAHFIAIRKAIQTALFIANKNSVFYLGYILPTSITQYLDNIVHQLMLYDRKLSLLCKDPRYGATEEDRYKDILWTRISYTAAGLAATAIIATDYQYGLGTSAYWLFNGLFNIGKKSFGYMPTQENNQKQEDTSVQNLTPQEKFKKAQEQLSKAQQTESKIYEDAIAQHKKNLQTIVMQKESQEKKLGIINFNLEIITEQQSSKLKKVDPENRNSQNPVIDQQKVQIAQKISEKNLETLKKSAFRSPKEQAALERKIKETELELANYENILYTIQEKQNIEKSLQKTEQLVQQENKKLIQAQQ